MQLLIVESPNKIQKLRGFLPKDFRVAASVGHIRDLPSSGDLAIRFAEHIEPQYVITKPEVVEKLRAEAARAETIWLATDPDREGEAIAWHLTQVLGQHPYQRVAFQAITRNAVTSALQQPRQLDTDLVQAQQARRVLDRVVGWTVSPVLRGALGKGARSAGRVQSVALRVVAEREEEISAFVKQDYALLEADLRAQGQGFTARLSHLEGAELGHRLAQVSDAEALDEQLRPGPWQVERVDETRQHKSPPPPFTTSTAQQAASVRLRIGPQECMAALQRLFEGGHITYHRTDSTALAPEAMQAARQWIQAQHPQALPEKPRQYQAKDPNAQEAHEAIRPTHPEHGPEAAPGPDARLYRLIWERFIACQMKDAVDDQTTARIISTQRSDAIFTAIGVVERDPGFRILTREDAADDQAEKSDDDDGHAVLPPLQSGQTVDLHRLRVVKRTTKPPPRYTQASLIRRLERDGIGRPSTYAAMLNTILARDYVLEKARKLQATDLGLQVNAWLRDHFRDDFIEIGYTAHLEAQLDAIARGKANWEQVVRSASDALCARAQAAGLAADPRAAAPKAPPCPSCGAPMRLRQGKHGGFFGCSTWPQCNGTLPAPGQAPRADSPRPRPDSAPTLAAAAAPGCPRCGGSMRLEQEGGMALFSCRNYPQCRGTAPA